MRCGSGIELRTRSEEVPEQKRPLLKSLSPVRRAKQLCGHGLVMPTVGEPMVKPQYIEIPSYDALTSWPPTPFMRRSEADRLLTGSAGAFSENDRPISPVSPEALTALSGCDPRGLGSPRRLAIVDALYSRMDKAPVLRNTYFFDHRSGGFVSIPHLGNHVCTTALGIFRVIENWIEEKLFTYTPVGPDGEEFVPILEENVSTSALAVVRKLEAAAKAFTGLSSVAVHIRTGHVYTLECSEDLVVGDEVEHFFQQFPLFVDVSLRFCRCPVSTSAFAQPQFSGAFQSPHYAEQHAGNEVEEFALPAADIIADLHLRSPHSTCIVVKMSSDIKQFEIDRPDVSHESEEIESARLLAAGAYGLGDLSMASSRTVVPSSQDGRSSPRQFFPSHNIDSCQQLGSGTATPVFEDAELDQLSPTCVDLDEFSDLDDIDSISAMKEGGDWPAGAMEEDGYLELRFYSDTNSSRFQPAVPASPEKGTCCGPFREAVSTDETSNYECHAGREARDTAAAVIETLEDRYSATLLTRVTW